MDSELTEDQTIEALRLEKQDLTDKNNELEATVKSLKKKIEELTTSTEAETEAMTLKLIKRMETLQKERETLANQVEKEEEHIKNSLLKKIESLQLEKVQLEQQLEYEQETIVNRFNRQITAIQQEKKDLQTKVREDTHKLLATVQTSLDLLYQARSASATPANEPRTTDIRAQLEEVNRRLRRSQNLRDNQAPSPSTNANSSASNSAPSTPKPDLRDEIDRLAVENVVMQEKVREGEAKVRDVLNGLTRMDRGLSDYSDYDSITRPMVIAGTPGEDIQGKRSRSSSAYAAKADSRHNSMSRD